MTSWIVACQAPLSIRFSRQDYWSGLPFPPPGELPNPGIEPRSPALAGGFFTTEPPGKPNIIGIFIKRGKCGHLHTHRIQIELRVILPNAKAAGAIKSGRSKEGPFPRVFRMDFWPPAP